MLRACVVLCCVALVLGVGPYSFKQFESEFLNWHSAFKVPNSGAGAFNIDRNQSTPSVYGSADSVALYYMLGHLDSLTPQDLDNWASVINSFQNSSGFYTPSPAEYWCGFYPWHTSAFSVSALHILGRESTYLPEWAYNIAANQNLWNATFEPLLTDSIGIWEAGHKIAAIPAVLLVIGVSDKFQPFFDWYWNWLEENNDPKSGYWVKNPVWAPPSMQGLGGAFHMFFVYTCAHKEWTYPAAAMNSSLSIQKPQGYWNVPPPSFAELDGVYEITRSSVFLGNQSWSAVEAACDRYLNYLAPILNNQTQLWNSYTNTHILVGAVASVAECQKWFPNLVQTTVPWKLSVDYGCYI